jgi:hypothetical protein
MRVLLSALVAGLLLLFGTVGAVWAEETWCDTDPAVVIRTPAGNTVVVFVTDAGPIEHRTDLLHAAVDVDTQSVAGGAATQVRLTVTIPSSDGGQYAVHSEVWTAASRGGTLLSSADGLAGAALTHRFRLDIP